MPSPITPQALQPGDTIAWISPSARLVEEMPAVMARATAVLQNRGYKVKSFYTPNTPTIQSNINARLSEIRDAFFDAEVKAIICTIGGPSFTELIPALAADTALHAQIRAHPKIVVGFSDISGLHWFLHAHTGLRTFYGPGALTELGDVGSVDDADSPLAFCAENLFRAIEAPPRALGTIPRSERYAPTLPLFVHPSSTDPAPLAPSPAWKWLRPGKGQGRLFGGCLTVIARVGAVPSLRPDWKGRIVFVETAMADHDGDAGNPLARVRAGFADLIAAGVFEEAAGLVVGRPFGYNTEEQREEYAGVIRGLLCEGRLAEKNPFPILMNVDIGHTTPMVTLPYDVMAELDSERDRFAVLEAAIA